MLFDLLDNLINLLDDIVSRALGWFIIESIYHPALSFLGIMLFFFLYLWGIEKIGQRYEKKLISEALRDAEMQKGNQVPIGDNNVSERLRESEKDNE